MTKTITTINKSLEGNII